MAYGLCSLPSLPLCFCPCPVSLGVTQQAHPTQGLPPARVLPQEDLRATLPCPFAQPCPLFLPVRTVLWAAELNLLFLQTVASPSPWAVAGALRHLLPVQLFSCRKFMFPELGSKHHLFPSRPAGVLKTRPPLPARIAKSDLTTGQVAFHTGVISQPHAWVSAGGRSEADKDKA